MQFYFPPCSAVFSFMFLSLFITIPKHSNILEWKEATADQITLAAHHRDPRIRTWLVRKSVSRRATRCKIEKVSPFKFSPMKFIMWLSLLLLSFVLSLYSLSNAIMQMTMIKQKKICAEISFFPIPLYSSLMYK